MDILKAAGFRLRALVHEVDMPLVSTLLADLAYTVTSTAAEAEAQSRSRARDISSWLIERAGRLGADAVVKTVRCPSEALIDRFVSAGVASDLVMLALSGAPEGPSQAIDLLVATGSPVLILPDTVDAAVPVGALRIALAWDGTSTAARAVRDAMPLLAVASDVAILVVQGDKDIPVEAHEHILGWLRHHGMDPRLVVRERGEHAVGDILQATALSQGCNLLVMGAYGHGRLRELVLGGATRSVLHHLSMPVLMSH
jgi:nucleotide-binding universal stress UspA family protein